MSTAANDLPASPPPPSGDAASLPDGYRLNEYQIERSLGGGGFGITYLARDGNLDLPVALKEYFPSDLVTRNPDYAVQVRGGNEQAQGQYNWGLERFLDEARVLATFRHPNIVRVLRYFRANGTAYIVMEYESGLSLKRWVPQNAPLSQKALLSIIYPLLDGLEAVHKTGFLHRDIKPDNIYVRADNTPVLLDFGAARRVTANRDMTNIVSPGFAPFEQYHSQGNQGPWTDIYSLGAVMYWMTTGKKPLESAARVKSDAMLPASSLAEASVFGATLLRAIEWAMQPDESQRPQTVSAFRAAIQGAEKPDLDGATTRLDPRTMVATGTAMSVPGSSTTPSLSNPSTLQKRNLLCTIMFLDLVGYSARSVDNQVAVKKLFNELIGKALKSVPEDTRITIDTGDGAAIVFMGDPEEALHSALLLRDLLGQRYGSMLSMRVGLHMGPVRLVTDINERINVLGDGINVAQRVMDFAQPNQVLVSRSYYDVISRIADETAEMFRYLGPYDDKHGRSHEVYAVEPPRQDANTTRREGPATGYTRTQPIKAVQPLDEDAVHDMEGELARHIGPLAKVLVRKARQRVVTLQELREALAPSIPEPRMREAFLAGPQSAGSGHSTSQASTKGVRSSLFGASSISRPVSGPPSQPVHQPFRSSVSQPLSQPMSQPLSRPASQTLRSGSPTQPGGVGLSDAELTAIEQALSKFIGPMARMLVRKQLGQSRNLREFISGTAAQIDRAEERDAFLVAARRALHGRDF